MIHGGEVSSFREKKRNPRLNLRLDFLFPSGKHSFIDIANEDTVSSVFLSERYRIHTCRNLKGPEPIDSHLEPKRNELIDVSIAVHSDDVNAMISESVHYSSIPGGHELFEQSRGDEG